MGAQVDVVLVGNPRSGSRTRDAAERLMRRLSEAPFQIVDLADFSLEQDPMAVEGAWDAISSAQLAVVASPTYQATYTGLLKMFLESRRSRSVADVVAVPLMLGASERHALAAQVHLTPLLTEVGFRVPFPGLFLLETEYIESPALDAWLERARPALSALRLQDD